MQNETNQTPLDLSATEAAQNAAVVHPESRMNLQLAREAKRMSVGDAAYALKVNPRVIAALETGRWDDLPSRTFAVGILRAYGRLLEISVDDLVEQIPGASSVNRVESAVPKQRSTPAKSRRDGESKRQTHGMLKSGIVMVAVAVVLAYGVPGAFWTEAMRYGQALYEGVRGGQPSAPFAQNAPAGVPVPTTDQAAATASAAPAEPQAQTGTGTLELRFSAPAWVEVRDYTGRIIYSQLNAAGTTQFITGAAPLDVMIGNARQVQARWRDEPVKLDKLSGDDVARQTLR